MIGGAADTRSGRLPATVILSLVLLRPIKGATLGLLLKLGLMKPAGE